MILTVDFPIKNIISDNHNYYGSQYYQAKSINVCRPPSNNQSSALSLIKGDSIIIINRQDDIIKLLKSRNNKRY